MTKLKGVIAAAATPLAADLSIDLYRLVSHCRWLLGEGGCDGINLLGTTGEATSFSVGQRIEAMRAEGNASDSRQCEYRFGWTAGRALHLSRPSGGAAEDEPGRSGRREHGRQVYSLVRRLRWTMCVSTRADES
jgi:hypothetical protein